MKWIVGRVSFTVQNGSVPLINKLKDFKITNVTLDAHDALRFQAPLVHKKSIARMVGKHDYTVTENRSAIRAASFLYMNLFLTCALIGSIMILSLLNNFIFRIQVTGVEGEEHAIASSLIPTNTLTLKHRVDKGAIETALVALPFVAHVSTQIRGTRLVVNIHPVESAPDDPTTDMLSRFDAVVTSIVVASGTPLVVVGQAVSIGQILVQGESAKGIVHGEVRKGVTATATSADKEQVIHQLFVRLLNESGGIIFDATELYFNQTDTDTFAIELVGIANIVIS